MIKLFNLEKKYFDVIDNNGNCFIAYWAELYILIIKINFSSIIINNSENITTEKVSLTKTDKPNQDNDFTFKNKKLGITFVFNGKKTGVKEELYQNIQEEKLVWDCHHPLASVSLYYDGINYRGLGYSETIHMSLAPWELPIDELRWGRYLSQDTSIVWIEWKGSNPLRKIYYNSSYYEDGSIDNEKLVFGSGKYQVYFLSPSVIYEGKISNHLKNLNWLKWIINKRILETIEVKFKSKAIFKVNDSMMNTGWSLYEIVKWKK
ncbi:MAG: hypothetical protein JNL75_04490 [Chitinophagales bacterium]|nr:hypothetical protein [Chitinophagales bacterium]